MNDICVAGRSPYSREDVAVDSSNEKWQAPRFRWIVATIAIVFLLTGACYRQSPPGGKQALGGPKGQFGTSTETLDYLKKLNFTLSALGANVLVGKYACTTPGNKCPSEGVRLMFIPEQDAEHSNWKKAMGDGGEGYVVAAVVNVDGMEFTDLALKPGEIAYAWVGQIGAAVSDRGFGVYKVNSQTGVAGAPWSLTTDVKFCEDTQRDKPIILEKHPGTSECKPIKAAQASRGVALAYAAAPPSAVALLRGVGQLWISCDQGCCEVKTT